MPAPEPLALGPASLGPDQLAPPPDPAPDAAAGDVRAKAEIEAAMLAAPADAALRARYIAHLTRMAGACSGLLCAMLPDLGGPLWFRAGTPDITALAQVFRDGAYAIEDLPATPQRILVIGAYAGYAAVDLARRHPRALLLCAEPMPDNLRLLALNTAGWRRIRVVPAAVWHSATRLAPVGRLQADWAVRLSDEAPDADRTIAALPVGALLARAGWPHADMVVCDAAGAERAIFADPLAPWLRHLDVALVRAYEQLAPAGASLVAACFPDDLFSRRRQGQAELFARRTPLTALPEQPPELPLLRAEPGASPFRLHDVAAYAWAFFIFDGSSCQLHPNPPGGKPARAAFPLALAGQRRLLSGLAHAGTAAAGAIRFTARLQRPDGGLIAEASETVAAHATGRLALALPEGLAGPALAVLQTEMAAGAPHNQMAWARWIDPRLR